MATAGDVNGDGFADLVVGAPLFDGGQADEGRAFLYEGSAAGPFSSPGWTAESDQASARFGASVGTAGDVNGDGYSDVIAGAPWYGNGEPLGGRASEFHGSAAGLSTAAAWVAEGNQGFAGFGWVQGAGDVNGDGFSDVIVGAWDYDNGEVDEGRAFVFHGSAAGLSAVPAWTGEPDQAGASYGTAAGAAGDVNGDGYGDVIVGAYQYSNGQSGEGRVFVYLGSPAGLAATPVWTGESNQAQASYGTSVGTAGDVNGDGFSDIVVGAPRLAAGEVDEGRAYLYFGLPQGPTAAPVWTVEANQAGALLGFSVGTAGDVNGDGFGDVIAGALQYSNGEAGEGAAFLYYGNRGDGLDRIPRQALASNTAPIDILGKSDSQSGFLLKALGRTAAGRGKVRLQSQVEPLGTAFGLGIASGPSFDTGAPVLGVGSAVPLSGLAGGLAAGTAYHWRLRIDGRSPLFPRTPWLSLAGNCVTEKDLRTAGPPAGIAAAGPAPAAPLLLKPGRPSPFGREMEIAYVLARAGRVRLAAYDVAGRERAVLVDGVARAGRHTVAWDGRAAAGSDLPAGVYLLRLEAAGGAASRKVVLAR